MIIGRAVIIIMCFLLLSCQAKADDIDTVLIRQFSYSVYNGGLTNYSATQGQDYNLFFGNSAGLLIYDGSNWELIKIGNNDQVLAVLADGKRIYVGGWDELGYVELNKENEWQYLSLKDQVPADVESNEFWQIIKTDNGVYFQSFENLLLFDGETIRSIDIPDSYIYKIDNKVLCSSFDGKIFFLEGDSIFQSLETPALVGDAAFAIINLKSPNQYLYLTAEHGPWLLKTDLLTLEPWNKPIADKLKSAGLYHGTEYRDSLIIASTWTEGVLIFNKEGQLFEQFNLKQGLPNGELREVFVDKNENIWVLSNSGIYQMRLTLNPLNPSFLPITNIVSLKTSTGHNYNLNEDILIYDPQTIVFSFTTPGLDKEELEYSFYLEGSDEDWTIWTKQYTKEYSNLQNKNYTFHVKSRPEGSDLESQAALLEFSVKLPWYKRTIYFVILLALMIVIILIILRLRAQQMYKARRNLELMVNTRTKELNIEREKLEEINKELQLANNELDHFVYRSSHDLIAPLKSLLGLMSIAKMESKEEHILNYIAMMERSTLKLEDFIKSIMEYSMNSKKDVDSTKVNLKEIITEILEEIKYFDKAKEVEFKLELGVTEITTDVERLKIVLNNLITNAIKHHKPHEANPWIEIGSNRLENCVMIWVADNGLGIAEEHLNKIYDMFFRASENANGSGLGLYIVKETLIKLGGTIDIRSELNKGTKAEVTLPVSV